MIEQSTKLPNFILILLILHNIFSTCSHALFKKTLLSTFLSPYHLKTNDNWDGCFLVGTLAPIAFQVIAKSSPKLKVRSLFFKFQFGDYFKLMVCQFCIHCKISSNVFQQSTINFMTITLKYMVLINNWAF